MDAPFRIRSVELPDLPGIAAIESASFSDPWSVRDFRESAASGIPFLVAEADGAVVGYIIAHHGGGEAEILNLGVAPAARRRGVGRALVGAILVALHETGVGAVFLEVRESNTAAQRLYGALGFSEVGRRRRYYQVPAEDAVILRVEI